VLLTFLGLWTWKLLEPYPVPEELTAQMTETMKFAAAKSLHAVGYGFLTLLAVTLPVPRYWQWFFVGLLALHGVMTEIGQTFVPNRHGSPRDVLIDWCGIALAVTVWQGIQWGVRRRE
jgi:VanZ family protein